MRLPSPETRLAGCAFLARIVAKARALRAGALPGDYAVRFGAADSVDGLFLAFFGLSAEQITEAAELSDESIAQWFETVANVPRIQEWNHVAVNLGRPGFPMAERLPIALSTKYRHLANRRIE